MDKRIIKSGVGYVIGDVFGKCITLITTLIFTRILTKAEYGNVTNFTAWYAILSVIATMSLDATINRARFDFKKEFDIYISSLLALGSVITFCIYMSFRGVRTNIVDVLGMDWKYITFMFLCMFFSPALVFFQARQMFSYNYKSTLFVSALVSLGGLLSSLLLVNFWKNKEAALIIGTQLPSLIVSCIIYMCYMIKGAGIRLKYWKYALKICLPYVPHLISLNLLVNMDRVIIKNVCGSKDAAMYSIAYSSSLVITILLNATNNAMSPWIGEKLHEKKYDEIRNVSKVYVLIFTIPALLFMLIVPEVLLILGGKSYLEAKYVLAPLVMACICQFMYTMYVNIEQYEKKTIGMAVASVISAIVNFILNVWLIPKFGYSVAAYTTLASYMLLLFMHMLLVKRMGLIKVYHTGFILVVLLFAIGITLIIVHLYKFNWLIRYLVLFISTISCVVYLYKKKYFKYIKR